MHHFKELIIWKNGFEIGLSILKLTKSFPKSELYSLTSQMNRSAVSIASNIAEGAGRNSKKEFDQFLSIAVGSTYELETQLMFALELKYIDQQTFDTIITELHRLLRMLRKFKEHLRMPQPSTN